MIHRLLNPSKLQSFFLLGPRGSGKSTLLRHLFSPSDPTTLWIDLLSEQDEDQFGRHPDALSAVIAARTELKSIIIDEIQKFPKLLDIAHQQIEANKKRGLRFILTGSSARKLKRSHANLLAGRAITYALHPLTHLELDSEFNLRSALEFGTLPKILELKDQKDEINLFLKTYVKTFLKEEVIAEQIIRNVEPFRDFLPIAAQMNGEIIQHSKIARDIGVDYKTVQSYFEILCDTLIGFNLPPFHRSIRKRQRLASKFYLFDPGIKRALESSLSIPLLKGSSSFGKAFEHWIIIEVIRLNDYFNKDFKLSYLRTKDDAEIDLIIERPGKSDLLIEIKSTEKATSEDAKNVSRFQKDWDRKCISEVWSLDPIEKKYDQTTLKHWKIALKDLFSA